MAVKGQRAQTNLYTADLAEEFFCPAIQIGAGFCNKMRYRGITRRHIWQIE